MESLRFSLACPICFDLSFDPVVLSSCGHGMCGTCAAFVGSPKGSCNERLGLEQRHIVCPLCRKKGLISPNFPLRNVLAWYAAQECGKQEDSVAGGCSEVTSATTLTTLVTTATQKFDNTSTKTEHNEALVATTSIASAADNSGDDTCDSTTTAMRQTPTEEIVQARLTFVLDEGFKIVRRVLTADRCVGVKREFCVSVAIDKTSVVLRGALRNIAAARERIVRIVLEMQEHASTTHDTRHDTTYDSINHPLPLRQLRDVFDSTADFGPFSSHFTSPPSLSPTFADPDDPRRPRFQLSPPFPGYSPFSFPTSPGFINFPSPTYQPVSPPHFSVFNPPNVNAHTATPAPAPATFRESQLRLRRAADDTLSPLVVSLPSSVPAPNSPSNASPSAPSELFLASGSANMNGVPTPAVLASPPPPPYTTSLSGTSHIDRDALIQSVVDARSHVRRSAFFPSLPRDSLSPPVLAASIHFRSRARQHDATRLSTHSTRRRRRSSSQPAPSDDQQ